MTNPDPRLDPRFLAGVQLLQRTGAQGFRIGFSPEDDGDPIVWYAVATWAGKKAGGFKVRGSERSEAAGGMDPITAVMRLCEAVIDGGMCTHCQRQTIFVADLADRSQALYDMGCVYAWDPELATFRRSCEGTA